MPEGCRARIEQASVGPHAHWLLRGAAAFSASTTRPNANLFKPTPLIWYRMRCGATVEAGAACTQLRTANCSWRAGFTRTGGACRGTLFVAAQLGLQGQFWCCKAL